MLMVLASLMFCSSWEIAVVHFNTNLQERKIYQNAGDTDVLSYFYRDKFEFGKSMQSGRFSVMVVDYVEENLRLLEIMLEDDYHVHLCRSGAECLAQLPEVKPDLILLDVVMPEMDGWAVLKTLKEDPYLKDIPVIMVSIVENKPMALDVGALDSLTKPIAWDRLLDLTRNVVRNIESKK